MNLSVIQERGALPAIPPADLTWSGRPLLLQLDGKVENIALMRLAHAIRARGGDLAFCHVGNATALDRVLAEHPTGTVFASLIFEKTRPLAERLLAFRPDAVLGGTGWDLTTTLESIGVTSKKLDYSIYPNCTHSVGFTQRGCRLRCKFCVVPKKEGAVVEEQTIADIWRGDPYPRHLLLLDNDFFGQPNWRQRVKEIRDGGFKVSFNQGINARFIDEESAEALTSMDYRDDSMTERRIYTAWDNKKDEDRLMRGLELLVKYGARPRHLMVYMLVGYWPDETHEDRDYRRAALRKFGVLPYPMPYVRTPETVGFQRWVIGGYDKSIPWQEWAEANYQPRNLKRRVAVPVSQSDLSIPSAPSPALAAPLLKYPGSKRWLVPHLAARLHARLTSIPGSVYVEPFFGSGALGLSIGHPRSYYADANPDLVNFHTVVRDLPGAFADAVDTRRALDSEEEYYRARESLSDASLSPVERAALFVWVNRNCFNGMVRYSPDGGFNVPWGRKGRGGGVAGLPSRDLVLAASRALAGSEICREDFSVTLDRVLPRASRAVIFLDPPYGAPLQNTSGDGGASTMFTGYSTDFVWRDQVRVAGWANALAARGAVVVVSNTWAPEVCDLYREGFSLLQAGVRHSVGSTGARRGKRAEMLAVSKGHEDLIGGIA